MTTRERALLLRLAACMETGEAELFIRRALRDLGWSDERIDTTLARIRESVRE